MTNREQRKALRAAVTKAVNRVDPMGLLDLGAPDDEYEPEVLSLIDGLADAWPDQTKVFHLCEAVFAYWFGSKGMDRQRLKQMAADLVADLWALAMNEGQPDASGGE